METSANGLPTSTQPTPRKLFTPEQRRELLERYRRSGLKQEQFIAGEGISKATLGKWLQQERRQARQAAQAVQFQELKLPTSAKWAVEIVSPQNWTLRLAQVPSPVIWNQLSRALPC